MTNKKLPRVIVVGAGGGHLTEGLLATNNVPMIRYIATYKLPHTEGWLENEKFYPLVDPHGSLVKYAINVMQSLRILVAVRPHVVISTGGGISIAVSLLGKLFGARLVYIESGARVCTHSRTGDLLYRFSDLFIVQWRPLLDRYPKAVYGGLLL